MSEFKTLYVERPVLNPDDVLWLCVEWSLTLPKHAPHVTLIYSRGLVDWSSPVFAPDSKPLFVPQTRFPVWLFGDCVVLGLESPLLKERHEALRACGATSDFPTYNPHITIGKNPDESLCLPDFVLLPKPFEFGPECRFEVEDDD